uniref:Uncharacterized protein n=1 Tax=Jaculus jaculus TaxID=51337 RepID=A0A8C5KHL9_JACJA
MTWSLPDGSLISGFHSEESFWEQSAGRTHNTRELVPHIALQGTWTGSPGQWCCWPCRCTLQRRCTGRSSRSETTREHGCAPLRARPESTGRKRAESEPE